MLPILLFQSARRWCLAGALGSLLLAWEKGSAQTTQPLPVHLLNHDVAPKSPTAAALGRFGEVPVSLYTGVPSIEIPLYALKGRDLTVPVKLQYHGGGVRLDDQASWVGMGWSLNAGGVITHTVRGINDLEPGGYILSKTPGAPPVPLTIPDRCGTDREAGLPDYYHYAQQVLEGLWDSQPDLFSFNFLSYSGKIIFDQQGQAHISPNQPLAVTPPSTTNPSWTITDEHGTRYLFRQADAEYTRMYTPGQLLPTQLQDPAPSTWYLSEIISLSGESAHFYYKTYTSQIAYAIPRLDTQLKLYDWGGTNGHLAYGPTSMLAGEPYSTGEAPWSTVNYGADPDAQCGTCRPCDRALQEYSMKSGLDTYVGKLLDSIRLGDKKLLFHSSRARQDYPGQLYQLDSLRLLTREVGYQRSAQFTYGTYGTSSRHLLTAVQQAGRSASAGWQRDRPYTFAYVPAAVTSGFDTPGSFATDRWGFFNNAAANQNGFLPFQGNYLMAIGYLSGSDREINPAHVGYGLLQRITYPTGGSSDFEFEPHEFSNIARGQNFREEREHFAICVANPDPATGLPTCGGTPTTYDFTVDHPETVRFSCAVTEPNPPPPSSPEPGQPPGSGIPDEGVDDVSVRLWVERLDGSGTTTEVTVLNNALSVRPGSAALSPGAYRLHASSSPGTRYVQVNVTGEHVRWIRNPRFARQGGGVRIKRITAYDGLSHAQDQVKDYYYTFEGDSVSSGVLIHQPIFHTFVTRKFKAVVNTQEQHYYCQYVFRSTHDLMTASGTVAGSEVGYSQVTVVQRGGSTCLKTISTFLNQGVPKAELMTPPTPNQGLVGNNTYDDNGLLLTQAAYAVTPGSDPLVATNCRLVKQTTLDYGSENAAYQELVIPGISITGGMGTYGPSDVEACRGVASYSYKTYVGWYPVRETRETSYDAAGTAFTTTTHTYYDNLRHLQPTRQTVTASGSVGRPGGTYLTAYKYPLDYAPGTGNVSQLQQAHFWARPLEEQRWRMTPTDSLWVSGRATSYQQLPSGAIAPTQIQVARLAVPDASLPPPRARSPLTLYSSLLPSFLYEPRARFRYTARGALQEQRLVGDSPAAILWDQAEQHPIAEAKGASCQAVAYTSFEAGAPGSWEVEVTASPAATPAASPPAACTGRATFLLNRRERVRRVNLPVGTYQLTCWAFGNAVPQVLVNGVGAATGLQLTATRPDGWHAYAATLQVPAGGQVTLDVAAVQAALAVDELRLYPVGTQLTSYTYDPLDNLTSQTDATGRFTTYEYDGLGRLVRTRDEQGRLLGQQQYHYAGQP